ncbi:MAG: hypothetical protein U0166_01290 [Acidobacteriota bacterium]
MYAREEQIAAMNPASSADSNTLPTYLDGSPVRVGDVIEHDGRQATVVAVPPRGEFSHDFDDELWHAHQRGFVLRYDGNEVVIWDVVCEADDMHLVSRATTP